MLGGFLALLAGGFVVWILFRNIRTNPEAFSKSNLNQSFMTMGLLALLLIAVVGFAVIMLR